MYLINLFIYFYSVGFFFWTMKISLNCTKQRKEHVKQEQTYTSKVIVLDNYNTKKN